MRDKSYKKKKKSYRRFQILLIRRWGLEDRGFFFVLLLLLFSGCLIRKVEFIILNYKAFAFQNTLFDYFFSKILIKCLKNNTK